MTTIKLQDDAISGSLSDLEKAINKQRSTFVDGQLGIKKSTYKLASTKKVSALNDLLKSKGYNNNLEDFITNKMSVGRSSVDMSTIKGIDMRLVNAHIASVKALNEHLEKIDAPVKIQDYKRTWSWSEDKDDEVESPATTVAK